MAHPVKVVVLTDPERLAATVSEAFAALVLGRREGVWAALAGGRTPRGAYARLARRRDLPWEGVTFFFGDERAVPPDHPESNFRGAWETLLRHVPARHHPMPAAAGDAAGYAALLAQEVPARRDGVPALDLAILGVGPDGHTASLFPGDPAAAERERWVVLAKGGERMTLTLPVFQAARRVWFLAQGREKAAVVAAAVRAMEDGVKDHPWPVVAARPREGEVVWWVDRAAAEELR